MRQFKFTNDGAMSVLSLETPDHQQYSSIEYHLPDDVLYSLASNGPVKAAEKVVAAVNAILACRDGVVHMDHAHRLKGIPHPKPAVVDLAAVEDEHVADEDDGGRHRVLGKLLSKEEY